MNPSTAARVRQVEEGDLAKLSKLDSIVFGSLAYPYFVLRQFYDVHRGELLVMEQGGRLRGYSIAVRTTAPDLGWFLALGVEPASRRRGYGLALALTSLDILREHDVARVLLSVNSNNLPAVGLYSKLGFHLMDEAEDYLGPGEPRLLLELHLQPELAGPPPGGRWTSVPSPRM